MVLSSLQLAAFHLSTVVALLQPAATSAGGGSASADGGGGGGGGPGFGLNIALIAAVFAFTYFFMIRPEQKKREEAEQLLKSLKPGMKVRTSSGILGEIIRMNDQSVDLKVDEKVRINVLRSHIAGPEIEKREGDDKAASSNESRG